MQESHLSSPAQRKLRVNVHLDPSPSMGEGQGWG